MFYSETALNRHYRRNRSSVPLEFRSFREIRPFHCAYGCVEGACGDSLLCALEERCLVGRGILMGFELLSNMLKVVLILSYSERTLSI